jgi:hypothetical protein
MAVQVQVQRHHRRTVSFVVIVSHIKQKPPSYCIIINNKRHRRVLFSSYSNKIKKKRLSVIMKSLLVVCSLLHAASTAWAFVPAATFVPRAGLIHGTLSSSSSALFLASSTSSSTSTAVDFLKNLLESLSGPDGGKKLLEASSDKWKKSIYEAVGAPYPKADPANVAKALTDAMGRAENQFAILMGKAEDFVAVFPSDPVEYPDETPATSWVEVRLREKTNDELLVTMGVQMTQDSSSSINNGWLISSIDWEDFRDQFYPGLSGREWLRAF